MIVNPVTVTVISLLALKFVAEYILDKINNLHIMRHRNAIPHGFETFIDFKTYQKSIDYTLAKSKFSSFCGAFDFIVDAIVLFLGIIPILVVLSRGIFGISVVGQSASFLFINFALSLLSLPLSWWRQFRLEAAFGFNRSNQAIFWSDKVKGYCVSLILGIPVLSIVTYLFQTFRNSWWVLAWATLMTFQLAMIVVYPMLILPLFNKLTPLPEGALKDRLMQLAEATHFPINKIFTIDGSKRSSHSNAFFTGIGKFRHIVLYDTLIEQMTPEELAAILAHEIGHYKKHHIRTHLIIEGVCSLIGFFLLYYLSSVTWFLENFGFDLGYIFVPLILIFSIAISGVTFWMQPFFNRLSRKHEYEADHFAKTALGDAMPLITSLRKLHEKNLSNLTPHPIFSEFYYSHPTLLEREGALLTSRD